MSRIFTKSELKQIITGGKKHGVDYKEEDLKKITFDQAFVNTEGVVVVLPEEKKTQ